MSDISTHESAQRSPGLDSLDFEWVGPDTGFPVLNVIIAAIPVIFVFWTSLLNGPLWRIRVGIWIQEARWSTAYASFLNRLRTYLQKMFGPAWSFKAFEICFCIALIYSTVLLIISIILFLSPSIVIVGFIELISSILITYVIFRKIVHHYRDTKIDKLTLYVYMYKYFSESIIYILMWIVVLLIFVMHGFIFQEKSMLVGLAFLTGAVVGAVIGSGIWALSPLVVYIVVLNYLIGLKAFNNLFLIILIIYIALPVINAFLDWVSCAVSRFFIRRLQSDAINEVFSARLGWLIIHIVVDLCLAILFLYSLAVIMVSLRSLVYQNTELGGLLEVFGFTKFFPLSGPGIVLTVMLISTIIPTLIHLFFAIFAMAVIKPPYREYYVKWLEEDEGGGEWGNRVIVSTYLSFWTIFAFVVLWAAFRCALSGLDALWAWFGWGTYPNYFWTSVFDTAEFLCFTC